MRDDDRFEVSRAMDLLPHVAGASFATVWFRMGGKRRPTGDEFRAKTAEYFGLACRALETFPDTQEFCDIKAYIRDRVERETKDIVRGRNQEVEKRYRRYLDYG